MDELAKERYDLAVERIREIREEKTVAEPYLDFFTKTAGFLEEMICLRNRVETGEMKKLSLEELRLLLYWHNSRHGRYALCRQMLLT